LQENPLLAFYVLRSRASTHGIDLTKEKTAAFTGGLVMTNDIRGDLKNCLLSLDMDATLERVNSVINGGAAITVKDAVDAISEALEVVGKRFQHGEWFLTELVYAGEIAKEVMKRLGPLMAAGTSEKIGTIVAGTVVGDLHDLGKNIFINYAESAGFEIIDLGIDVPTDKFLSAVYEHKPIALGMSCLLTITAEEVGKVIEGLKSRDIRDSVKVIIGGAALTAQFAKEVGADAFAPDAISGTDIVKRWSRS
jgi:methanogenic corrinoid protein MtbC1